MKKIKIAFITEQIRENGAGIGQYSQSVIEYLLKSYDKHIEPTYVDFKESNFNKDHLLLLAYPFGFLRYYFWFFLLPFRLKKYAFDYIFLLNPVPHPFPFRQKEVLFIHDLTLETHTHLHPFIRVVMHWLFFKMRLKHASIIVANSEDTKKQLLKIYPWIKSKLFIIPYVYIQNKIEPKRPKFVLPQKYILNVNTLEPRKNIINLLYAYAELRNKFHFPLTLIIVGKKGWMYKEIFQTVQKLDLQNHVVFTGFVTEEEKLYLLENAEMFVYPSFYEGYGIPVLEAMLYKCPVITSNNSNLADIANGVSITVDPYNYKEISNAIYKLHSDQPLREKLSEKAYKRANQLMNSQAINKSFEQLFKQL